MGGGGILLRQYNKLQVHTSYLKCWVEPFHVATSQARQNPDRAKTLGLLLLSGFLPLQPACHAFPQAGGKSTLNQTARKLTCLSNIYSNILTTF
jgi:hypothetical protein